MSDEEKDSKNLRDDNERMKTMTEKGKEYKLYLLDKERSTSQRAWRKQIRKLEDLLASSEDIDVIRNEMQFLETRFEMLAAAYENFEESQESLEERRLTTEKLEHLEQEHTEVLKGTNRRVAELRQSLEDNSSVCSSRSHRSKSSRSSEKSKTSVKKDEVATRVANLKTELRLTDIEAQQEAAVAKHEGQMKRFQITKSLEIAKAEMEELTKIKEDVFEELELPPETSSEDRLQDYVTSQMSLVMSSISNHNSTVTQHQNDVRNGTTNFEAIKTEQCPKNSISPSNPFTPLPNYQLKPNISHSPSNPFTPLPDYELKPRISSSPSNPFTPSPDYELKPKISSSLSNPFASLPNYKLEPKISLSPLNPFTPLPNTQTTPITVTKPATATNSNKDSLQKLADLLSERRSKDSLPLPEPEIFKGDLLQYPIWLKSFETIVEGQTDNPSHRLYYLGKYSAGEAKEAISGLLPLDTPEAYAEAKKILQNRFGNSFLVAEAYRKKISEWPRIPANDGMALRKFSDFLIHCQTAMIKIKYLKALDDPNENQNIAKKLPKNLIDRWGRIVDKWTSEENDGANAPTHEMRYPPFSEFSAFLAREARIACNPVISSRIIKPEEKKGEDVADTRKKDNINFKERPYKTYNTRSFSTGSHEVQDAFSQGQKNEGKQNSCVLCKESHSLDDCKEFLESSIEERVKFVRTKGLCLGCLTWGHMRKSCRKRMNCNTCNGFHPTSLHDNTYVPNWKEDAPKQVKETKPIQARATSNCVEVSAKNHDNCIAHSLIVPVWLHHIKEPNNRLLVYALLDDQSDACFVKDSALKKLSVNGPQVQLKLSTVLAEDYIDCQKISGLVVRGLNEETDIPLPTGTYSRDRIPARRNQIPRPATARNWPHLEIVASQLMPYRDDVEVGLLIGLNCARAIKPKEIIPGTDDDPYAKKTALGWGVIGIVDQRATSDDDNHCSCHQILSREVKIDSQRKLCHFALNTQVKEIIIPTQITQMFELDFNETKNDQQALSHDDRRFMQKVKEGIHKRQDGHYEIPLPFREDKIKLPNNKQLALNRLLKLKGRLRRDERYRSHYQQFMNDTIAKGHAEKVPTAELCLDDGQVWYIPHHGVYHSKKPDKIRIVFDASAEFEGESLNRHLLQGPDLTNNLAGVLCRFRKEPIAFMCDIEGMFHQVNVSAQHRNFLRFLWWEDGDIDKNLVEYRMAVHLFGAGSSPGCANFALKTTADDQQEQFGTEAAEFVRDDFYVDDGLKSVPTATEAISLIENTRSMCAEGGFNLHKFLSNSKEVIKVIPKEQRAKGIKDLDITKDHLPIERALGVQWCVEGDQLQFRVELKDRPLTRRGILSTVSSIYDPLGMVAPFLLIGKSILQELCKDKAGWDDKVPEPIQARWEKWRSEIHSLADVNIPRCYKPEDFGECTSVELHSFSDASLIGYGECTYVRMVNSKNEVHCSLVMAKSRVTPLKSVTIPRLELAAALVSTKISTFVNKELKYGNTPERFWTDSQVVLGYISNDAKRFHTFVANRVQQIRDLTSPKQWKYVDTKENPADDASRGLSAKDLIDNTRWWNGPSFLWNPLQYDGAANVEPSISLEDPEVRTVTVLASTTKELPTLLERLEYFSNWHRAKGAFALCLRYIHKLKSKSKVEKDNHTYQGKSGPVSVEEMQSAERVIFKAIQGESFVDEIERLRIHDRRSQVGKAAAKRSSSIYRLDPFLDEEGILRVGGRINQANLPYEVRHPVLLPKKGHVTQLIVRHYHQQASHQGRTRTHADIRAAGVWIIDGSSAVGYHISRCVTCRRLRGALQQQKMADLPEDRLEPAPPFTYSAVDYFGPWHIKEGRREMKRYGVLFTCMASRAIHLETAASLTTDSFINAYRRFVGRRGPIRQLRSDQGTNFVGAKNELEAALGEMNHDVIQRAMLKNNCDWIPFKMNVPHASHMGGVWERQIRTVRGVLASLLKDHGMQLDDESLRTLMIEAEAIVNSRPLTTEGLASPDSLDALTPNHLLTMKSKVVLPPPGSFQRADLYSRKRWRRVQHLANEFWYRWRKGYLQTLQERQKWLRPHRNLQAGDVVVLKEENTPRSSWQLARVIESYADDKGLVRKVKVTVADSSLDSKGRRISSHKSQVLERPIHKLVLLLRNDD